MLKSVLKNFAKLTGKHLCRSLFFNKVAGLRERETERDRDRDRDREKERDRDRQRDRERERSKEHGCPHKQYYNVLH